MYSPKRESENRRDLDASVAKFRLFFSESIPETPSPTSTFASTFASFTSWKGPGEDKCNSDIFYCAKHGLLEDFKKALASISSVNGEVDEKKIGEVFGQVNDHGYNCVGYAAAHGKWKFVEVIMRHFGGFIEMSAKTISLTPSEGGFSSCFCLSPIE